LKALVKSSAQIAKLVKWLTTKDLKQYGCITPTNIDGIGLVVQGCLETIVNATYYPYCAKFRDELVAPVPSPILGYERGAQGETVVLGCAVKIEDEYDQAVKQEAKATAASPSDPRLNGNNKKRKTSS
jgi:hypothetical protein